MIIDVARKTICINSGASFDKFKDNFLEILLLSVTPRPTINEKMFYSTIKNLVISELWECLSINYFHKQLILK